MTSDRAKILDPMERSSVILFGSIMVSTFTGSFSVVSAGREALTSEDPSIAEPLPDVAELAPRARVRGRTHPRAAGLARAPMPWDRSQRLLRHHPLPHARTVHSIYARAATH